MLILVFYFFYMTKKNKNKILISFIYFYLLPLQSLYIEMKISKILSALEQFAPLPLQDGYDNAGLQVGLTEAEATGALLCLDVTEEIIDEAVAHGCNLIISHHPLLFKGIKSVTGSNMVERCLMKAIRHDIVLYASHTNLDNAPQGVSFMMATKIGLKAVRVLEPLGDSLLKFVTFVPASHADIVRNALFVAGCGCIGNYDACSYNIEGDGTFRAQDGTHPFCGTIGELHHEHEVRIETIIPAYKQQAVIDAMKSVHPYEEPAYDLYPLKNGWSQAGSGVVGELDVPESEEDFLYRIKDVFNVACVRHNRFSGRMIKKVALCGGAGAFLIPKAILAKADVFVTGEIKYHEFFGYENDILLSEIGHYESEQFTKELLYSKLSAWFPQLKIELTKINTNPINYI